MANIYLIGNAPNIAFDGDGTLPTPATSNGGPGAYKLPPGNSFGTNDYYVVAGAVLDFGAVRPTGGFNTHIYKYGSGPNPKFVSTNAAGLFDISTGYGMILDGIDFIKSGAVAGIGVNLNSCSNSEQPGMVIRNCKFANFTTAIDAKGCYTLDAQNNEFVGTTTTLAIDGSTSASCPICLNWKIINNTCTNIGVAFKLVTSDSANNAGAFTGLRIHGNKINGTLGGALVMQSPMNATDSTALASVATNSIVRNAGSPVWPAWGNGAIIFLSGWSNPANFGLATVVSGGGTRTVVLSGITMVNEADGQNKGAWLFDAAKAFVKPEITDNVLTGQGQTPMLLASMRNAVISGNTITDATTNSDATAAGIEIGGSLYPLVEHNTIRRISGSELIDGMGIFFDGGTVGGIARFNRISDITPAPSPSDNSRAALAMFYASGCKMYSNITERCYRGFWAGGTAGTGHQVYNNVFSGHTIGIRTNSSPPAGSISFWNNLVIGCATAADLTYTSPVSNYNAYWNNTVGGYVDANPVITNPLVNSDFRPSEGSPLLTGGITSIGFLRDMDRKQDRNHIGAFGTAALKLLV